MLDGQPWSLPIPAGRYSGGRAYRELAGERAALAAWASRGRVAAETLCHLDPDIDAAALAERPAEWRGAFGQVGAAQGHLRNQGVGVGDLFLFFGLFRPAVRHEDGWRWDGEAAHHLFGWLRVGMVTRGSEGRPWLADHPHAAPGWSADNTIYLAADRLDLPGARELPGAGVFARSHRLTAPDAPCCEWAVPPWLERARMSYRGQDRWWPAPGRMDARGQWQEGVAPADDEALAWAGALIAAHA